MNITQRLAERLRKEGWKVSEEVVLLRSGKPGRPPAVDLLLPDLRPPVAIEVQGWMHYQPCFGYEELERRKAIDNWKKQLIRNKGWRLIELFINSRYDLPEQFETLVELLKNPDRLQVWQCV